MLTPRIQRAKKTKSTTSKNTRNKKEKRKRTTWGRGETRRTGSGGKNTGRTDADSQNTEQEHMKVKLQSKTGNQSHKLKHDEQIHLLEDVCRDITSPQSVCASVYMPVI